MRVLVVDDEPNIMRLVEKNLTKHGYTVGTAGDGAEALAKIKATPPDVLMVDTMMPVMEGFELVDTLRADPLFATLKIILLTARSPMANPNDYANVQETGKWGRIWCLSKPFNPQELIQMVSRIAGVT